MAQLGHVWTQVGLSMRAMVLCGGIWCQSWAQDSQKNVGNSGKNISFQRVALGPQNWLGLGLTWARPAPKGAKLGRPKLGPKRCRWTPRRSKVMHIEVQVTSTVVQLGTLSNEASLIAKKVKNTSENGYFEDFRLAGLSSILKHMDLNLGRTCSLRHLGAKLGRSWAKCVQVGALLVCCGHVGSKRCIWTMLCMCNFWRPVLSEHGPNPKLKLYQ